MTSDSISLDHSAAIEGLIERSFASEVGGEVRLTYAPTGLVCRLEAPLASMQEPREAVAA